MPTKSAVEAAIGADDELGEELLESDLSDRYESVCDR